MEGANPWKVDFLFVNLKLSVIVCYQGLITLGIHRIFSFSKVLIEYRIGVDVAEKLHMYVVLGSYVWNKPSVSTKVTFPVMESDVHHIKVGKIRNMKS